MKLRILSALCAVVMLFPLFAACKKEPSSQQTSVTLDRTYAVIYSASADAYTKKVVDHLCRSFSLAGIRLLAKEDSVPATDKEILIGSTSRRTDDKQDAAVFTEGERLCFRAPNSEALALLVYAFCKAVVPAGTVTERVAVDEGALAAAVAEATKMSSEKITILTQNLRNHDDGNGNDVADRKERFEQLVREAQPDIIGTQEATKNWYGILEEKFGAEYTLLGCSRDGKDKTSGEWSAVLVRKERFDVLESDTFWLTSTPNTPSLTEGAKYRRIATWALLKDKMTGTQLLYCNTHLDHLSDDAVRMKQAEILMGFLNEKAADLPVFLTGDFNSTKTSGSHKYIAKTLTEARGAALADLSTVNYTYHNYGKSAKELDYCFYKRTSALALSARIWDKSYGGYVSDHYGVVCSFVI